ncbi:MAG: hypothetical protein FJ363_11550 [Gemmatimonadetes bacterium]|nr:hypothetical protein [Gemmatimonadota bacterium]
MTIRLPLACLALSCAAIGGAYASSFLPGGAPVWAAWGVALGGAGALASMMALGATRRGRVRPIALGVSALTFVVVAGAFGAALLLPPEAPDAPLLLGLPVRAALVLYGVGIVPLLFLPLAYALSFDADTLDAGDLERVRRAARESAAAANPAATPELPRATESAP